MDYNIRTAGRKKSEPIWPVASAIALVIALAVGGIWWYLSWQRSDSRGRGDAPITSVYKPKWEIINAPDGYGNTATTCNPAQPGTRIYIPTHSKTDVRPIIQVDESC